MGMQVKPTTQRGKAYAKLLRGDPCSYCGGPGGTIDHIRPLSGHPLLPPQGGGIGKQNWQNYTSACLSCNREKGVRGLLEFLLKRLAPSPPPSPILTTWSRPPHYENP